MLTLEILYQDDRLVVVNKPSGLLVHPSAEASDRKTCLSILRDQLGRYVYPLHRLDRGTSGILLMGLDSETARLMQGAFIRREVSKTYLAIVRGWLNEEGVLDRPLRKTGGEKETALTRYRTLAHSKLPYPVGNYPEARYSLVRAFPVTGRRHQIRRHLSNASYPIVGDAVHGDGKHNRLFRQLFSCYHLLLHAEAIEFIHPFQKESVVLTTPPHKDFAEICARMGWNVNAELS
ncbi:MAG: pseudouridylate synthase [Ignavibacteriae bacterium]|nr:pseudouridylate synthase [Ignavibacteriota bacterium]MCB9217682.1 pseudouridylate synthase [Ignavibacteria bacterium]